ncbi:unnamed protein product [Rotaria magnacalcarata]
MTLDLRSNQIGENGAQHLARGLDQSTINTLLLGRNRLGDKGLKHLAGFLVSSISLLRLSLKHNCIQGEGAREITRAIEHRQTPLYIDIIESSSREQVDFTDLHLVVFGGSQPTDVLNRSWRRNDLDRIIKSLTVANCQLTTLKLHTDIELFNIVPWSHISTIKNLYIPFCTLSQYREILDSLSHLRTLAVTDFTCQNDGENILIRNQTLLSLTISGCSLSMDIIKLVISLTPALTYLKIYSARKEFDSIFDGASWEQFFKEELPALSKFEFFFFYKWKDRAGFINSGSLLDSFHTLYWLHQNLLQITCQYHIQGRTTCLYSTPIPLTQGGLFSIANKVSFSVVIRWVLLPKDGSQTTILDCYCKSKWIPKRYGSYESETKTIVCKCMRLQSMRLGPLETKYFAPAIKTLKAATKVDLSHNEIGSEGLEYIVDSLKFNTTVQMLSLGWNNIGDEGIRHIVDLLSYSKSLTGLYLQRNGITETGAQLLALALKSNETINTLNIGCNPIGPEGAKYIAGVLMANKTITVLNMSENSLGDLGAQYMAKAIKLNTSLTKLNLQNNGIGSHGAKHLFNALIGNKNLTSIELSAKLIGYDIIILANALADNKTVTSINLRFNEIKDQHLKYLVDALKYDTKIRFLSLEHNEINDQGAENIAGLLRNNKTLQKLELNNNFVGNKGAMMIADALQSNKTLTCLDLSSSKIGDVVLQHILLSLANNTMLTTLILDDNSITSACVLKLVPILHNKPTLEELRISSNSIDLLGGQAIAEAVQDNKVLV